MIEKMNISGYFIDEDTAELIGEVLDHHHDYLANRLAKSRKHEISIAKKNEIVVKMMEIEEICQTFEVEGY